jgi:hypothetical protein
MPNLVDLPVELHLSILERPPLTILDLIRLRVTSIYWHTIIETTKAIQERLFLRPLAFPHSMSPNHNHIRLDIHTIVRHVPSTIWNDHDHGLYEMIWLLDVDADDMEYRYCHLNPFVQNMGNWMHLINRHFHHAERVNSCYGTPPPPLSLHFRELDELKILTFHGHDDSVASWHNILVSRALMHSFQVCWSIGMRFGAREYCFAGYVCSAPRTEEHVRMRDFVHDCRKAL